jgi:hypothetical protein
MFDNDNDDDDDDDGEKDIAHPVHSHRQYSTVLPALGILIDRTCRKKNVADTFESRSSR